MENTNSVAVAEITLTAHDLSDRTVRDGSLRERESSIRGMFERGWSIRTIAKHFDVSYEWARRIAKNVAYDYDDVTIEAAVDEVPNLVVAF
jgi:hypothetical protein